MINELQNIGINVKRTDRGDTKVKCPKCSASRKNKNEPCLSVNVDTGVWNCHNCQWAGAIKTNKKEYTIPEQKELQKIPNELLEWFEKRKITNQTLLRYRVSFSKFYSPQHEKEIGWINYNYYDPTGDTIINTKYRSGSKDFRLVGGAQLGLYGIDVACQNSNDEIIIVEGENDVLAWYEAGVKIAVSVPNGSAKQKEGKELKLEWLDEWMPWLEDKKVYLCTDNDTPGLFLRDELARRIGKQNCFIIELPSKDANDTLIEHGDQSLLHAFRTAKPYPVEGIEVADATNLLSLYDQGYPKGLSTGWDLDNSFKIFPGQFTLITGIPGHGKTTWLKNLMVRMASRHDWKFFVYSGEEASTSFAMASLMTIHSQKPFFEYPGLARINRMDVEKLTPYMNDHFMYYSLLNNEMTIEGVLEKAKEMVVRFGINAIVVDNMSSLEKRLSKNNDTRHHELGSMLGELIKFARNHDVHVFVVAHPKKMQMMGKQYGAPSGYDVGDSSHYFNKPDNGITIYRNMETGLTELQRWKVRFPYTGTIGNDYFNYNIATDTFKSTQNETNNSTRFRGQNASSQEGEDDNYGRLIAAGSV